MSGEIVPCDRDRVSELLLQSGIPSLDRNRFVMIIACLMRKSVHINQENAVVLSKRASGGDSSATYRCFDGRNGRRSGSRIRQTEKIASIIKPVEVEGVFVLKRASVVHGVEEIDDVFLSDCRVSHGETHHLRGDVGKFCWSVIDEGNRRR